MQGNHSKECVSTRVALNPIVRVCESKPSQISGVSGREAWLQVSIHRAESYSDFLQRCGCPWHPAVSVYAKCQASSVCQRDGLNLNGNLIIVIEAQHQVNDSHPFHATLTLPQNCLRNRLHRMPRAKQNKQPLQKWQR